ncbi:hypothetical protein P7L74_15890 [Tistrella mobilis]|uniref:STM4504/CBY_0614 family protein n=1 Tax=Tistrella mobilis TaxID=171437 RepID=UPI0035570807
MGITDLFSKRQKRERGEAPDVYVYNSLPEPLRVQILYIIRDAVGVDRCEYSCAKDLYTDINHILCREFGVLTLTEHAMLMSDRDVIFSFLLKEKSVERVIDVVELFFRKIEEYIALSELNARFQEHGVGYRFELGRIIRIDSQFMHSEIVKPTLLVLNNKEFEGANEEFLRAHEHYRHGRYKECLVAALNSFESTMKTICSLRGWETQPKNTAKNLISICLDNGLLAPYSETQLSSLRALLESGIPTIRNKNGGHGQGTSPVAVPGYLARYALNLTATTILMMVQANNCEK